MQQTTLSTDHEQLQTLVPLNPSSLFKQLQTLVPLNPSSLFKQLQTLVSTIERFPWTTIQQNQYVYDERMDEPGFTQNSYYLFKCTTPYFDLRFEFYAGHLMFYTIHTFGSTKPTRAGFNLSTTSDTLVFKSFVTDLQQVIDLYPGVLRTQDKVWMFSRPLNEILYSNETDSYLTTKARVKFLDVKSGRLRKFKPKHIKSLLESINTNSAYWSFNGH